MEETEEIGAASTPDARDQEALDIVHDICDISGLDMAAECTGKEQAYLQIELVGADASETFGKHGKSLDALQYLVNLIVARRVGSEVRVMLDAGGYRERRIAALTAMAQEYAAQVRDRQEECEIELPPHERRIIHQALQDSEGIRTFSEGVGNDRRVIIAPRV